MPPPHVIAHKERVDTTFRPQIHASPHC